MGGDWDGKDIGESAEIQGLAAVRRTILSRYLAGVDQITIDIDATVIKAEKREAKMTYKGFSGYTPLLAFVDGGKAVLWDEFREGNVSPNSRAVSALDACEAEAKSLRVRISGLRSDAAYYQAAVFDWAEDRGIGFAIGAPQDPAVADTIDTIPDGDWRPVPDTDREYAEVVHSMNGTKKAFRLVVQRWKREKEQLELFPWFYHVIATNRVEDALAIIRWYNQRGSCEDAIGELKHGFGAATLPCGTAEANAVWFRLVTIAYNLGALFSSCLPDHLADKRVGTLRLRSLSSTSGFCLNPSTGPPPSLFARAGAGF